MKSIRIATLLTVTLLLCSSPLGAAPTAGLQGTWESKAEGFSYVLVLAPDGSGVFDDEVMTYSVQGRALSIKAEEYTEQYAFTLTGDRLTLSGGDLDGTLVFERRGSVKGVSQPEAAAAPL